MPKDIKNETLTFTSKFTDFEIVSKEFTKCRCYALASGDNVNGSDITMSAIDKAISRGEFYNKPIVAHLYKDEDDGSWRVGGHDSKWVITNTSMEVVNECIPFGTIPESANVHKEEVLEADGITTNTYVVMDILLWTGRFNIMDAAYSDDVYFNQSCELSINEYHYKENDVLAIDDFTFSALCLLNKSDDNSKNVRPCFGSCRVEKIKNFSVNEGSFKKNYELLLEDLKKFSIDNKATKTESNPQKGEFKMDLTKFTTLLSEIKYGDDCQKYSLLGANEENIYVADREDSKLYSVGYADTEDGVIINWDTKKEADITYTEKAENEENSTFSNILKDFEDDFNKKFEKEFDAKLETKVKEISDDAESRLSEMKEKYSDIQNSYAVAKEKLDKFEAIEAEKAKENHINAVKETLERFEKKIGKTPEFIYYKAKVDYEKVDIDAMEKELTLMTGDILMNKKDTNKTFSYNPTSTNVKTVTENETSSRYGNLLDEFMN